MVSLDAAALRVDPGRVALGNVPESELVQAENNPEGPACQASLAAFRSALFFRNVFTALVAVLAGVTVVVIAFCLFRILDGSWDSTSTFAAIGAAVTGTGALFVRGLRTQSIRVLRTALSDVGRYCGEPVRRELA